MPTSRVPGTSQSASIKMGKAAEKERPMPYSLGLPIFDEATGAYVARKPASKPAAAQLSSSSRTVKKLRDMTPFHKGYNAVRGNKRSLRPSTTTSSSPLSPSSSAKRKRADNVDFPDPEPDNKKSRFLAPGDDKHPLVYNPSSGRFERLYFTATGAYDPEASRGYRGPDIRQTGNYSLIHAPAPLKEGPAAVRRKNCGLAPDNPVVLFPGDPLVVADRKARELAAEFPGVPLDQALALEKRKRAAEAEADADADKERGEKRARKATPASAAVVSGTGSSRPTSRPKVDLAAWFRHGKGPVNAAASKGTAVGVVRVVKETGKEDGEDGNGKGKTKRKSEEEESPAVVVEVAGRGEVVVD